MAARSRGSHPYGLLIAVGYGALCTATSIGVGALAVGLFAGRSEIGRTALFLVGMTAVGLPATLAAGRILSLVMPLGSVLRSAAEPPGRQLRAVPDPR